MKHLLIVYHSQSGNNAKLAQAVLRGAQQEEIEIRLVRAFDANTSDLLWADAVIFGSAENFGYLAGGLTDFFARTFYPYQQYAPQRSLPYAMFCSTGNDGSGAVRQLQRIARGYPLRDIAEPVIVRGEIKEEGLKRCEELGLAVGAGLALGIY